jgi:serine/threonine protein kinase/tetratricopeptide (TPR) repeat protein
MNAPKSEETILEEALRLPAGERAAYLAQSTEGNPELRQWITSLLRNYDAGNFLEHAAAPELRKTFCSVPLLEKPGDLIGRYKLLEQIGEGGCGVVYVAEQLEPVRRRVALKIIKLGMDTKSVIARFEAERQALAMMDHPNIAKVLDAGATETGRPYFVMELVRGLRITDYCDEKKLSTRERLDLFILVCQAVQHAHQKGIIHRDIKPSNILVTVNDGAPVPKVIDFGIAKVTTGQPLTDKTVYTAFEQFIGTPAYMSPEQATLTSLDIDTRSDIYGLGILLYELLTGKTPFDAQELLAVGLDEMRRTIREQEPPRPSTRLSTLGAPDLSTAAKRRGLDAPKLVSELRGDLDWIVMKALEKDRARRYETANGLAADIQRHLSNEPVVACPPATLYRIRKAVQRHKLAFAAGGAVLGSLMIGLTLSTVLFFRERAARKQSNEQRARATEQFEIANAVKSFLIEDLLGQADSGAQAQSGCTPNPDLTVREALERAAKRISRFKNQPLQEAGVRNAIGSSWSRLGETDRGIAQLERALELCRATAEPDHPATLAIMYELALAYHGAGKFELALPLHEQTLKLSKARFGPNHSNTLDAMHNLAITYRETGKLNLAVPLLEEIVKLRKATEGIEERQTLGSMLTLADTYRQAGKVDQARPLLDQTLKLAKARLGSLDPYTQTAMECLAMIYRDAGNLDQALLIFLDSLSLRKAALGLAHPETVQNMKRVADIYIRTGKPEEALPFLDETLKAQRLRLGPDHPETLIAIHDLADAYHGADKDDQALPLLEEAVKLEKGKLGADSNRWKTLGNLCFTYKATGKPAQAALLQGELIKATRVAAEKDDAEALNSIAWVLATSDNPALRDGPGAVRYAERALAIKAKEHFKTSGDRSGSLDTLAAAYAEAGDFAKAAALQREAISLCSDQNSKNAFGERLKLFESNTPFRE